MATRSERMYSDSPSMERGDDGKVAVRKKSSASKSKPKSDMANMHDRHGRELAEAHKRHEDELKALHGRHQQESADAEATEDEAGTQASPAEVPNGGDA